MIVKGSMNYDQFGRKRKKVAKRSKKAMTFKAKQPDFKKQSKKTMYPSAKPTEYTTPEDTSYKKEISKQYTVSIAYNKGAYQVIPKNAVKDIGK